MRPVVESRVKQALEFFNAHHNTESPEILNAAHNISKNISSRFFDLVSWGGDPETLKMKSHQVQYDTYLHLLGEATNQRIRERGGSISIAVIGTGGGIGKTDTSANVAINIAHAAQTPTLMIESNENDGTLHFKMGIRRHKFPCYPEAIRNPKLVNCCASIAANFGKHSQTTTYAILSHPENAESEDFTLGQFIAFSNEAEKHVGVVVYDTGNGLGRNEVAQLKADVVIVSIFADDETKFSTAFSTLANLYSKGHIDKVTKHSRIVITGAKPGSTLDDYRGQILEAVREARKSIVEQRDRWSIDPLEFLQVLGLARESYASDTHQEADTDPESKLVLCDEKFDLVAYSDYVHSKNPSSILPDETGIETIVGYLKVAYNAVTNDFPPHALKKSEERRRTHETNEARSRPMLDATSVESAKKVTDCMDATQLNNLMAAVARTKVETEMKESRHDKQLLNPILKQDPELLQKND
jgi:MinD-like ATPase involved in chromosome partitioning or flagellar assembly